MFSAYARAMSIAIFAIAVPNAVCADQSGTTTLTPNTFLNLDTGVASSTGGDIQWDGTALTPQGRAELYNLGKYGPRAFTLINARHAAAALYSAEPIPAGRLVAGEVFGVHTNRGNYAKVIVTAADGTSLALRYTLFLDTASAKVKAAAAGSAPVITGLANNYSYILSGLPNYGIAPGSLFLIFGTGLSLAGPLAVQSSAPPGLPTSFNQTSVSVTVKGVTTVPAIYWALPTGIAAVLPSNTPVGSGTITVTYNGQPSAPVPIQVVASAVGLDTLYGTGNGVGVVTDTNFRVLGLTNSAMPNQTVILWGSGIGADSASDDRTYPQNQDNLTTTPFQVYIGGISANVIYRGRSQFPGLDQYDVVIPQNVTPGCYVSVIMMTGTVVSNTVTLPVNPTPGPCSDSTTGLNGTQLQSMANKGSGNVNSLLLAIVQSNNPGDRGTSQSAALALPAPLSSADYGNGYEYTSQGSCVIVPPGQGSPSFIGSPLDVGTLQVSGPGGQVNLTGLDVALPGSGSPFPGAYTFTGSGGKDIGSFKVVVSTQTPLTITNGSALASITRSQGATVTWSGGFPNGDVQIEGDVGGKFGTVRFYCHAPSSAGQFAIPVPILLALTPGPGAIVVINTTAAQAFSASGLDVGLAAGLYSVKLDTTFK